MNPSPTRFRAGHGTPPGAHPGSSSFERPAGVEPRMLSEAYSREPLLPMELIIWLYWIGDIAVSFNTAFVREGLLVISRRQVALNYATNRFPFDFCLTVLDTIAVLSPVAPTDAFHQILQFFRLVRTLHMSRTTENLEELCIDLGMPWIIVVYTVWQIVVSVFVVGHFFSCAWCMMGMAQRADGEMGWVDYYDADHHTDLGMGDQYLRAVTWITGHLLSAPIDRTMTLRTQGDHAFAMVLIWVKLFVMGAAISKITGAIAEMGRANAQSKDAKRKLHQVILKAGMSKDASSRMIRFALHADRRKRATTVDPTVLGLLSGSMAKDLIVNQRMRILASHPLFSHLQDKHSDVFSSLCSTFKPQVFADLERSSPMGRSRSACTSRARAATCCRALSMR